MGEAVTGDLLGVLAVLLLVAANGFFVASEFALVTVRRSRVEQLLAEGRAGAAALKRATHHLDAYIAATQLGITMASLALGWVGEPALAHLLEPLFHLIPPLATVGTHAVSAALSFATITALHIVLGELAPKSLALQRAEATALAVVLPLEGFYRVFRPAVVLLNAAGNLVVRAVGLQPATGEESVHSPEELKLLVATSRRAGLLAEQEQQMLNRVFDFAEIAAHEVMVPRTEMVCVPVEASLPEVVRIATEHGYSRFPVYEGDLDHIVGVVHIRDLLRATQGDRRRFDLRRVMRDPIVMPDVVKVDLLLNEMKRRKTRLVILIDEFGGTAGLVTMEGLLERIVGDVGDEFKAPEPEISELEDGSTLIAGLTLIDEVNQRLGLNIDNSYYDTIGGYVFGAIGRRPEVGDEVHVDGRVLRVESLDGLRIAMVRLLPAVSPARVPEREQAAQ